MRRFIDRFIKVDGAYLNPLVHAMLFQTLVWGIAFVFFGWTDSVQASVLFELAHFHLYGGTVSVWGIGMLIVTFLNAAVVYFRSAKWARPVALFGFVLWLWAILLYALSGFLFQLLVAGLVNVVFWAYWYIMCSRFVHERTTK